MDIKLIQKKIIIIVLVVSFVILISFIINKSYKKEKFIQRIQPKLEYQLSEQNPFLNLCIAKSAEGSQEWLDKLKNIIEIETCSFDAGLNFSYPMILFPEATFNQLQKNDYSPVLRCFPISLMFEFNTPDIQSSLNTISTDIYTYILLKNNNNQFPPLEILKDDKNADIKAYWQPIYKKPKFTTKKYLQQFSNLKINPWSGMEMKYISLNTNAGNYIQTPTSYLTLYGKNTIEPMIISQFIDKIMRNQIEFVGLPFQISIPHNIVQLRNPHEGVKKYLELFR